MKKQPTHIDFNAPHVVFRGADGLVNFTQQSDGCCPGREVLAVLANFKQASEFCKRIKSGKPANSGQTKPPLGCLVNQ